MYKKYKKNKKKLQKYAHEIIPGLSGLLGKRHKCTYQEVTGLLTIKKLKG